jgi:hypothetical protein
VGIRVVCDIGSRDLHIWLRSRHGRRIGSQAQSTFSDRQHLAVYFAAGCTVIVAPVDARGAKRMASREPMIAISPSTMTIIRLGFICW